jgi:hypothetical protein
MARIAWIPPADAAMTTTHGAATPAVSDFREAFSGAIPHLDPPVTEHEVDGRRRLDAARLQFL